MMFDASGNGYYGHPTAGAKYTAYSIPSGGRGYDGFAYDSSGGSMIQFYDVQDIIKRSNNFSIWCRVRMNSKQTTEANIIEKNMTNGFSLKYLATGKLECTVGGMMGKYSNWLLDGSGPTIENDNTTWHDYGLSIQKEANTKTLARIYMDGKIVKTAEYMSSVNTNGWLLFGSTAALYDRVAYYDGVLDLDGFKALSDGGTL
ncbi:MAG TPA: LamG-like jellyroll fold domain-containing protein [Armatimonadota bacterium]|nr:LamG-like jellyroll fold domain-containing protein [Armatimonadota bacterium]